MSLIDTFTRLESLDHYIKTRNTGSRFELAAKMGISVSTVHEYLNFMKIILGAPIEYDHRYKTYFYAEEGSFDFGFQSKAEKLTDIELYRYLQKLWLSKQPEHKEGPVQEEARKEVRK